MNARERNKIIAETLGIEIPSPERFMAFALTSLRAGNNAEVVQALVCVMDLLLARIEKLEDKLKLLNVN